MSKLPCIRVNIIALFVVVVSPWSTGQELPKLSENRPYPVARPLFVEVEDFRSYFSPPEKIATKVAGGKVCFLQRETASVKERSTNDWQTVGDVLRDIKQLERSIPKPQIRVIKRDVIFQSPLLGPAMPASGLTKDFLNTKLTAGDIVFLCRRGEGP